MVFHFVFFFNSSDELIWHPLVYDMALKFSRAIFEFHGNLADATHFESGADYFEIRFSQHVYFSRALAFRPLYEALDGLRVTVRYKSIKKVAIQRFSAFLWSLCAN